MITRVGSIAVLSNDARKSADWYRDNLGFEILGAEGHSVFVRSPNSPGPLLHLCGHCDDLEMDAPGGRTGIWLQSGEIRYRKHEKSRQLIPSSDPVEVEKTYNELKKRGVEFTRELESTSWGKIAIFQGL